jgi:hypothetical protein
VHPALGFVLGVNGTGVPGVGGLIAPTRAALRLRLPSGISLEPSVAYYRQEAAFFGRQEALGAHAQVRVPVASHSKTELVAIGEGSAFFVDSDGAYSLSWGLGLERFLAPGFSLGIDATSGLVSRATATDSWSVGPLGDFSMSALAALYF